MTQKEEPVVVVSKKNFFHKNLRWLIPLVVIVIAVGIVAIVININSKKPTKKSNIIVNNVCTTQNNINLLSKFALYSNQNNISGQANIVSAVKKLSNYKNDPNCLYVIVIYYLNTSNPQANTYFKELQKEYNPKVGFSYALGYHLSMSEIKNSLAAMNSNMNQGIMYDN